MEREIKRILRLKYIYMIIAGLFVILCFTMAILTELDII